MSNSNSGCKEIQALVQALLWLRTSLPIPAATYTQAPGTALLEAAPPPAVALGLSDGPASPGSGSWGSVPTAHFPLRSPGNHQKATAPDASPTLPGDKLCIPLLSLGWLQGCGHAKGVLPGRAAWTVPAVPSAVPVELGPWAMTVRAWGGVR